MTNPAIRSKTLETLSTSFDDLLERLQEPGAREALDAAFHASPEELGRAAVEARIGQNPSWRPPFNFI